MTTNWNYQTKHIPITLNTDLVSYWKLDGDSTDSVGSNDGTDTDVDYESVASYYTRTVEDPFGRATTYVKQAQQFTVSSSGHITSVKLYLSKIGTPADNVVVQLCADNSGVPGTVLETGSAIAGSGIPANPSMAFFTSTFAGTTNMAVGTTYWVVISRSSTLDDSNYYHIEIGNTNVPYGGMFYYNGSSWAIVSGPYNFVFVVDSDGDTGKINQGAGFNGTTSKIVTGNINMPLNSTISCWFKTTHDAVIGFDNKNMFGISKIGSPYYPSFAFTQLQGSNRLYIEAIDSNNIGVDFYSANAINDGNWHFAVLTVSTPGGAGTLSTLSSYLDGVNAGTIYDGTPVPIKTVTYTGYFNGIPIWWGFENGADYWTGTMDECGYWERALTQAEITELYNGGSGKQLPVSVSDGWSYQTKH